MVVVITSTGGVTKRVFTFDRPLDPGLIAWAGEYLNEQLVGLGLGARALSRRLTDVSLGIVERAFLAVLAPAFTELAATAEQTLYMDGATRLLSEHRVQDVTQINALMTMLEQRVTLLGALAAALSTPDVLVRIGTENELPELRSLAMVAAGYGLPARPLGTVSLLGPVRMDYGQAISVVREASRQLSRFVSDVYDEG
jgi:heat-inducible transcriptional repressor